MSTASQTKNGVSDAKPQLIASVEQSPSARQIPWKKVAVFVVFAVGFFLVGVIPMWINANQYAGEREEAQQELRLKEMENLLAAAAINADRGDYEPARQLASDFFNMLRSQIGRGLNSDLSSQQRNELETLLSQRDDVITLLARSDPASAGRLSDMYVAYRKVMNNLGAQSEESTTADALRGFHVALN